MSEFSYLMDRAADQQINERIAQVRRSRLPGERRYRSGRLRHGRISGRQALAQGLHHLADRLAP